MPRSTSFRAVLACVLLGAASAPTALQAQGGLGADNIASVRTIDLAYNLFAGGVPLGRVGMTARIQGNDYRVESDLETAGIINRFWQAQIQASSNGAIDNNAIHPSLYDSFARRAGNRTQQVTMRYTDGVATVVADPPYPQKNPVSDKDKRDALDPPSAVLHVATGLSASADNPCGGVSPVFDGRRRYDIEMNYIRNVDVHLDNDLYNGEAMLCEVKYDQIAGYKQRIVEQGRSLPRMYAWVASIPSRADPGKHYLIPLRLWADTDFGVIAAVASRVKLDGAPLGSNQRAELLPAR